MADPSSRNLQAAPSYEPLPVDGISPPATPISDGPALPMQELPPGAARPRFQGSAIRDDGSMMRDSFASSTYNAGASANSSVYALNPSGPPGGNHSSSYLSAYRDDPNADEDSPSDQASVYADKTGPRYLEEKRSAYMSPHQKSKKWLFIGGGALLLVLAAVGVAVPLIMNKNKDGPSSGSTTDSGATSGPSGPTDTNTRVVVTGGDGSTVTMEDGTTFTYQNAFGGIWYFDPADPFNNGARAQSWSPALNETFKYGEDPVRGVNLGGWLNTEPFMQKFRSHASSFRLSTPALYEPYANETPAAIDEWTLSVHMRADTANGGIDQLEEHYKTFITEKDFAEIAAAGLNFVRIPLPFWAIEVRGDEPFLAKTCWTYFLKAIQWARKYGIRINLDFHALPGSQNGWNHSGKFGTINFLNGPMGYANAQRSLDYIRIIAEFISQPEYRDVVAMFGITNEPQASVFGKDQIQRFYLQAYEIIRTAGGVGTGNGPMISIHDGFLGATNWVGWLPNADRIAIDTHPYMAFGQPSADPVATFVKQPCAAWGAGMNASMAAFGLSAAGEYSLAVNDCGLYVNGVNLGTRFEGTYPGAPQAVGNCNDYVTWENWDDDLKETYRQIALSSMDALQNWFFWTWKIANSSVFNSVRSPAWSYKLGLDNGWMPKDPREAIGKCGNTDPFNGPLAPAAIGGQGADNIPADAKAALAWPPPEINIAGPVDMLPSYTPTGAVPTLPGPTFTVTSGQTTTTITGGNGWANPADTAGLMVEIAGCTYPDPWVGPDSAVPPVCAAAAGGGAAAPARRAEVTHLPTLR